MGDPGRVCGGLVLKLGIGVLPFASDSCISNLKSPRALLGLWVTSNWPIPRDIIFLPSYQAPASGASCHFDFEPQTAIQHCTGSGGKRSHGYFVHSGPGQLIAPKFWKSPAPSFHRCSAQQHPARQNVGSPTQQRPKTFSFAAGQTQVDRTRDNTPAKERPQYISQPRPNCEAPLGSPISFYICRPSLPLLPALASLQTSPRRHGQPPSPRHMAPNCLEHSRGIVNTPLSNQ